MAASRTNIPIKKGSHPTAAVAGWLRRKIQSTREENPQIKDNLLLAPTEGSLTRRSFRASRKALYRKKIFADAQSLETRVRGFKYLEDIYQSAFRRRSAIFFSTPEIQTRLKGIRRDFKEKILSIGNSDPNHRITGVISIANMMHQDPTMIKPLLPFVLFSLRDPYPQVAIQSMTALADLHRNPIVKSNPQFQRAIQSTAIPISKRLASNEPEVVRIALRFLTQLDYSGAFPKAVRLLSHVEPANRSRELNRKLGRDPSDAETSSRARDEQSIRRNAARYISRFAQTADAALSLRNKESVKVVYAGLLDSDVEIRRGSAKLLSMHPESLFILGDKERLSGAIARYFTAEKDKEIRGYLGQIIRGIVADQS